MNIKRPISQNSLLEKTHLLILCACFLLGTLLGYLVAGVGCRYSGLQSYFDDHFFIVSQVGMHVSPFTVLANCIRWPILVGVFSLTSIDFVAIPILMFLRGAVLSYSVSCLCSLLGYKGAVVSVVLFSLTALLELPALFMISCSSFPSLFVNRENSFKHRARIYLLASGMLVLSTALNSTVIPDLISAVSFRLYT